MEPNVDRGMWSVLVLLLAVGMGVGLTILFPQLSGYVQDTVRGFKDEADKKIVDGGYEVPKEDIPFASDDDFEWVGRFDGYSVPSKGSSKGYYKYIGADKEVHIPHTINGDPITNYYRMFYESEVTKVVSSNPEVTNMYRMFYKSAATSLDLSSFDTSKVTSMREMFEESAATSLDLSSFDTSNVTNMSQMFQGSQATIAYARSEADAQKFNNSSNKPRSLIFRVK